MHAVPFLLTYKNDLDILGVVTLRRSRRSKGAQRIFVGTSDEIHFVHEVTTDRATYWETVKDSIWQWVRNHDYLADLDVQNPDNDLLSMPLEQFKIHVASKGVVLRLY